MWSNDSHKKEVRTSLLEAGIKPSAPRLAIASYVCSTDTHPTAEEVKIEVEKIFPSVSLATVYNTLNLMVEKGMLKEVQDPRTRSVRYDCKTGPHFHFIDDETGEMTDLDPKMLRISPDQSLLNKDFRIQEIEVILRGRRIKPGSNNEGETNV